jgi:WbqC-like protein family
MPPHRQMAKGMERSGRMLAAHQPNFLPWLGYFYKMQKSDYFIFLDDVQLSRRSYTSRVKIWTLHGARWLTVPIITKGRFHQVISQTEIQHTTNWNNRIISTLQINYGKCNYFKTYFPELEALLQSHHKHLIDLNISLIYWLAKQFDIHTPVMKCSELQGVTGRATDRLASICKSVGIDRYLSGFGGQQYNDITVFNLFNIALLVYDFSHPVYPQRGLKFIPGLSSIDMLFNCGPKSGKILRGI